MSEPRFSLLVTRDVPGPSDYMAAVRVALVSEETVMVTVLLPGVNRQTALRARTPSEGDPPGAWHLIPWPAVEGFIKDACSDSNVWMRARKVEQPTVIGQESLVLMQNCPHPAIQKHVMGWVCLGCGGVIPSL